MMRGSSSSIAQNHRDYGATSSSANAITTIPDVNFAGFSPTEFMSLSENIAQNISAVISSWRYLEKALKSIGIQSDTQALRDRVHRTQTDTNGKIHATSKDLQRLTAVVRFGDKQQKLQVEKLTSEFYKIVEEYSKSQQMIASKMKQILLQTPTAQDDESVSELIQGREIQVRQQKQVENNLKFEHEMVIDRERRIIEIETDVLDYNQIMKELSILMQQQGEHVDQIETNIENGHADVEAAAAELVKAAEYRTRYRRKILILLAIAVIVGLIVTGILISQLKS